jgi:hypothetical protein
MHLGVDRCDSEVHLAYYMIGQEFYSGLTGIRDSKDWASAMTIFCDKARDNEELDFEILDVSGNAVRSRAGLPGPVWILLYQLARHY